MKTERGLQIVGGLHSVRTALQHGPEGIDALWVDSGRRDRRIQEILDMAARAGVSPRRVSRDELDALFPQGQHQGVVARTRAPRTLDEAGLKDLVAGLGEAPFLLVLDGVQDPHNLGACLRSADAAGVHAVIVPKDRAAGLTPVACKVASGAAESVPFAQVTNLARTLRWLKDEAGLWIVGAAGDAQVELYDADLGGPVALVLGGEEKGLRRLTREACDHVVRLPMKGQVESLNVSVATGICLFEAVRQRTRVARGAGER